MVTNRYDALNRLTEVEDGRGNTTVYVYDNEGNVTGETDRTGSTQTMVYDALGRMTALTDRNGHTWTFVYDADGNLIQSTEVATPGAEEGWYDYVPLTPGELHDLARDYVLAGTQPTKMDEVLVYGIYGEPYESEPETPSITLSSVHVPEDFEYQEELAFSVPMDGTIQNYFLWDGTVVDKNGDLVEVDYASGATKYVIVVTPETEENKIYNQFISFIVDPQSAFL